MPVEYNRRRRNGWCTLVVKRWGVSLPIIVNRICGNRAIRYWPQVTKPHRAWKNHRRSPWSVVNRLYSNLRNIGTFLISFPCRMNISKTKLPVRAKIEQNLPRNQKTFHGRPEPEFLNFWGAQESIPPSYVAWARICKRLWSPGIDSEESISPAYVAWRASTTNRVSYRPARPRIDACSP